MNGDEDMTNISGDPEEETREADLFEGATDSQEI